MSQTLLTDLIGDLVSDLRAPVMLRQVGIIVLCVVAGWLLARVLRQFLSTRAQLASVRRFGVESFVSVLGPWLITLMLALAKYLLAKSQSVHLLTLALPLAASLAVIRFVFFLMRRIFARHGQAGAAIVTFERIFALLAWLAVALYIIGWWDDVFDLLLETSLPLGRNKVSLAAILQAIVSVVVMVMLALWAGAALEERLMSVQGLHSSMRAVIARMGRALLILIALLSSLSLVGIDLTVLSVFGGALGVGLGLGLQKIASNYVSGFIILLDRSLTIGDMISVDKYSGKVTQINTRYTVLQGLDGVESILPNEMLVSGAVQNLSLSNKMLCLTTHITVAYDTDLDAVLLLLVAAAASVERVESAPAPSAVLKCFGADGLELEVGFWISDPENGRGGVSSDVNRAIWRTLQAHHISVPYPQREVRITGSAAGLPCAKTNTDDSSRFTTILP